MIDNFIADLRSRFDYTPADSGNSDSSRSGRSNYIQRFLADVLSGIEGAAIRQILGRGSNNSVTIDCIRQVIEVFTFLFVIK